MPEVTLEIVNPNRPDVIALINELDEFHVNLYPPESNHLLDINSLMQPNIRFMLALVQGKAIGCGAIRIQEDYAEIKRMYVRPAYRGMGIGYQVLSKLEGLAKELGLPTTRLETGIHNLDALKLYEHCGYSRRSPFGEYTDDPLSLYYEKQLLTI
jgi:putative acetyltransferase